jgi:hypothetical protein
MSENRLSFTVYDMDDMQTIFAFKRSNPHAKIESLSFNQKVMIKGGLTLLDLQCLGIKRLEIIDIVTEFDIENLPVTIEVLKL